MPTAPSSGKNKKSSSKTKISLTNKSSTTTKLRRASSKNNNISKKQSSSNKTRTVKSASSIKSNLSISSVGIGETSSISPDAYLRFRLMPEGLGTNVMNIYEHLVFDCVVYVITCNNHNTVALTSTDQKRMYSWFPFIPLRDVFTWNRVSRDGLAIILGKHKDTAGDIDPTMATLPDHTVNWINILRLQMPNTKRFHNRIVQLVNLVSSPKDTKCCQNTNRIRWVKLEDIQKRFKMDDLWGDEVVTLCRAMCSVNRIFLTEFTIDDIKNFCDSNTDEARLLKHINWTEDKVFELSFDYARHLYPATLMTINSFMVFLVKNELLSRNDKRFARLFKAFSADKEIVSFSHLLNGLACMDPNASNNLPARAKFAFNYYDQENKGILNNKAINELATDLASESKIAQLIKTFLDNNNKSNNVVLTQDNFVELMLNQNNTFPSSWLRLNKSYFDAKQKQKKDKSISRKSNYEQDWKSKMKDGNSGSLMKNIEGSASGQSCTYHDRKKYEYGLHGVTLDSTGRCVDPRTISDTWTLPWKDNQMTAQRFSLEIVFRSDSIANTFINLIRDFREKELKEKQQSSFGLLVAENDHSTLYQYVELLCEEIIQVLRNQPKLLRLASPLYIVGDLQGSLEDLFKYDSSVFRSVPTTPNTILFLGNYSGISFPFGIECILYLFALKVSLPNNIYLLRGRNELRSFNEFSLKKELTGKYGEKYGTKMYNLVNRVFDHLPLCAVINETLLATYSGIPNMIRHTKLVTVFDTNFSDNKYIELPDLEQMIPIGYEMLVNVPARYADENQVEEVMANDFTLSSTGRFYFFNHDAFSEFMKQNNFKYHIRSHNPTLDAYALCFRNRCLTIFSCCKFNNIPLDSTSIMLITDSGKIRFFRYERLNDELFTEGTTTVGSNSNISENASSGTTSSSGPSPVIKEKSLRYNKNNMINHT